MRGGLDRLQKEMDALTYNSRSVLNALIRSTVVSGSSKGFSTTRVGYEIILDRIDIYRLYRFYQEWEENDYSINDVSATSNQNSLKGFDTILAEQDAIPVRSDDGTETKGLTTSAIVKHSQTLYLNALNSASFNDADFWLGLIKNNNNPKLVSNSSPIPLNLRTPVFDENLATTRYNQHPTYLFPNGYYIMDALGYSGDGRDHRSDGRSWTIAGDEFVNINSPAVALGTVNENDIRKTAYLRNGNRDSNGDLNPLTWSTVWGYDTHARAKYSTAGGKGSFITANATGGVAIGVNLMSTGTYSSAIGGVENSSVGNYVDVSGGARNVSVGDYGAIHGGRNNIVGDQVYSFTFPVDDAIDTGDNCDNASVDGATGRQAVVISGNHATDFAIGDTVRLFNFTTKLDESKQIPFYSLNGDGFNRQELAITSVEFVDDVNNLNYNKTIITFTGNVATGISYVDGGLLSRYKLANGQKLGISSFATGESLIAMGENQAVVGQYNYINVTGVGLGDERTTEFSPRFVVGTGSNTTNRGNGLEIWDDLVTLQATPRNGSMNGTVLSYSGLEIGKQYVNIKTYDGSILYMGNTNYNNSGIDRVYLGYNNGARLEIYKTPTNNTYYDVNLYGNGNGIKLISTTATQNKTFINGGDDIFIGADRILGLQAESEIRLKTINSYINIDSANDLNVTWADNLNLSGNTFGALPTNDKSFAYALTEGNIADYTIDGSVSIDHLYRTGVYHIDNTMTFYLNNDIAMQTGLIYTNSPDWGLLNMVYSYESDPNHIDGIKLYSTTYNSDVTTDKNSHISVEKFRLDNGTLNTSTPKALAWNDDVESLGIFEDVIPYIQKIIVYDRGSDASNVEFSRDNEDGKAFILRTVKSLKMSRVGTTGFIYLRAQLVDIDLAVNDWIDGTSLIIWLDTSELGYKFTEVQDRTWDNLHPDFNSDPWSTRTPAQFYLDIHGSSGLKIGISKEFTAFEPVVQYQMFTEVRDV